MTLTPILVFTLSALLIGWLVPRRWQIWFLLVASLLAVFWLQPALPLRNLDFWLPAGTILLVLFVWSTTQSPPDSSSTSRRPWLYGLLAIFGVCLVLGLTRYQGPACCITSTRPPEIWRIALFLIIGGTAAFLPYFLKRNQRSTAAFAVVLILVIFIFLKSPWLSTQLSSWLREMTGQPVELANPSDIAWLGFSFLAFRLLHVLFDFRAGKIPAMQLEEFATYVLFFPALPAGPIDRVQRFLGDLRQPPDRPRSSSSAQNTLAGGWRILVGVFKKFFLADSLAVIALNSQNASQVESTAWLWVLLYAYALRIYFDFSGYTDIALGVARLMGVRLPENFASPYLKSSLTAFWNSWHITLAQWFRAYYFNPLTRFMRTHLRRVPAWLIILTGQLTTMFLIGIWHGLTWNFAIWGAWHGAGLFINNRWSELTRSRLGSAGERRTLQMALRFGGWFLTFNYVALGWVWFALPSPQMSLDVLRVLTGQ